MCKKQPVPLKTHIHPTLSTVSQSQSPLRHPVHDCHVTIHCIVVDISSSYRKREISHPIATPRSHSRRKCLAETHTYAHAHIPLPPFSHHITSPPPYINNPPKTKPTTPASTPHSPRPLTPTAAAAVEIVCVAVAVATTLPLTVPLWVVVITMAVLPVAVPVLAVLAVLTVEAVEAVDASLPVEAVLASLAVEAALAEAEAEPEPEALAPPAPRVPPVGPVEGEEAAVTELAADL